MRKDRQAELPLPGGNRPPKFTWTRYRISDRVDRYRLYVDGKETPFFVDRAKVRAHYTMGDPVGLHGAGMDRSSGCAATLGSFRNLGLAKARAEQLWTEWTDSGELELRLQAGEEGRKRFAARYGGGLS